MVARPGSRVIAPLAAIRLAAIAAVLSMAPSLRAQCKPCSPTPAPQLVDRSYIRLGDFDAIGAGEADAEVARRAVMRTLAPLQECHSRLLARGIRPEGKLAVSALVRADGKLEQVQRSAAPTLDGFGPCYGKLSRLRLPSSAARPTLTLRFDVEVAIVRAPRSTGK